MSETTNLHPTTEKVLKLVSKLELDQIILVHLQFKKIVLDLIENEEKNLQLKSQSLKETANQINGQ